MSQETLVGMVLVATIAIAFAIVEALKSGQYMKGVENSVRAVIGNERLSNEIETRISKWNEKDRRKINAFLDLIDPVTQFEWTDLEDDIKAWVRDMADGVVEDEARVQTRNPYIGVPDTAAGQESTGIG